MSRALMNVNESADAAFDCWPAATVARSTSRSLASPASRRATVIRRRLSASRAVCRDNRKRASAASARVYVVSTSTTAAARSERNCSRAARVERLRGADARAAQPRRLEGKLERDVAPRRRLRVARRQRWVRDRHEPSPPARVPQPSPRARVRRARRRRARSRSPRDASRAAERTAAFRHSKRQQQADPSRAKSRDRHAAADPVTRGSVASR